MARTVVVVVAIVVGGTVGFSGTDPDFALMVALPLMMVADWAVKDALMPVGSYVKLHFAGLNFVIGRRVVFSFMPLIVTHQHSLTFGQHWLGLKWPSAKHRCLKHEASLHLCSSAILRFSHADSALLVVACVVVVSIVVFTWPNALWITLPWTIRVSSDIRCCNASYACFCESFCW